MKIFSAMVNLLDKNSFNKQQFIGPNVGPINLLFVNVRLYLYLSVFVRKKGGRQFQAVILEGVTDFLRSGELGQEKRQRFSLPKPLSLSAFAACNWGARVILLRIYTVQWRYFFRGGRLRQKVCEALILYYRRPLRQGGG